VLVGADLGGWIAAEMMVRSTARFSRLVLVAPLAIKLRGRDERDIADMHGIARAEYLRLAWAEPAKGGADYTALPDTGIAIADGEDFNLLDPARVRSSGSRRPPGVAPACGRDNLALVEGNLTSSAVNCGP
jgi:pimeloyl-ACP methyl ester carboxylesterase